MTLGLSGPAWLIIGFHGFVIFVLALDLGLFRRRAQAVAFKEALIWSAAWIVLALAFAAGIVCYWPWWEPREPYAGPQRALEFLTGYLMEKALSLDNLFVFFIIFQYFNVPARLQHRVLVWGLLSAIVFRAAFIWAGAIILERFHGAIYAMGAFLVYAGARFAFGKHQQADPRSGRLLSFFRRFLRVVDCYDSDGFWVKRDGAWHATPLPLVLLAIETTDIIFAIDSIPAVFAVTDNPWIVYFSNIFAILGLRAMYFVMGHLLSKVRFLHWGLGALLVFAGVKMLLQDYWPISIPWALLAIATILALTVLFSILLPRTPQYHGIDQIKGTGSP
jgi:tellurite resistance protein TerC